LDVQKKKILEKREKLRLQKERISAGFLDESSAMKKLEEVILQKDIGEIRNTEFKNYD
jgi:hypothetical protein